MSQDILIRAREPEDVADVAELLNQPQAVWGTLQLPFTSQAERARKMAALPAGHTNFVAVIEGKVIGTLGMTRLEGRRTHVGTIGMAVHDAYAGRGAGTALMAAAVEHADKWLGLRRLELTVFPDNGRAIALYERFGFEREGLYRDYAWRDGAFVDCLAMARLRP
jgi:L-phenylalanine/L-methionine N-acetyltransferase